MDEIEKYRWIEWSKELQFIAQSALAYCRDVYDRERFERVREIAAEMMSVGSDTPMEKIKNLFCNETGYQTPKMDSRGVVIKDGKILLVQEANGLWTIPGGWIDANQTVATNVVKELYEEAGLDVKPVRLLALLDKNLHYASRFPYNVCRAFVLCEAIGGKFKKNVETIACGYFSLDELPPLAESKCCRYEIELCMRIAADNSSDVVFE